MAACFDRQIRERELFCNPRAVEAEAGCKGEAKLRITRREVRRMLSIHAIAQAKEYGCKFHATTLSLLHPSTALPPSSLAFTLQRFLHACHQLLASCNHSLVGGVKSLHGRPLPVVVLCFKSRRRVWLGVGLPWLHAALTAFDGSMLRRVSTSRRCRLASMIGSSSSAPPAAPTIPPPAAPTIPPPPAPPPVPPPFAPARRLMTVRRLTKVQRKENEGSLLASRFATPGFIRSLTREA